MACYCFELLWLNAFVSNVYVFRVWCIARVCLLCLSLRVCMIVCVLLNVCGLFVIVLRDVVCVLVVLFCMCLCLMC